MAVTWERRLGDLVSHGLRKLFLSVQGAHPLTCLSISCSVLKVEKGAFTLEDSKPCTALLYYK